MRRRLATSAVLVLVTLLGLAATAHASAPVPGLYEGSLPNGITVALSVIGHGQTATVRRVGAVCLTPDHLHAGTTDPIDSTEKRLVDPTYRIASDGSFAPSNLRGVAEFSGRLSGTTGIVRIGRTTNPVQNCDVPQSNPDLKGDYPVPVARVGPVRSNVVDGQWMRRDPYGQIGRLYVWAGGAFIGDLSVDPSLGPPSSPGCDETPAGLAYGVGLGTDGIFTMPWLITPPLQNYSPVTPATGAVAGDSGHLTYTLDSVYDVSQGCGPQPTTDALSLVHRAVDDPKPAAAPHTSSVVPGGGTQPSARCASGEHRTTAGRFVLCTTATPEVHGGSVTLTGRVTINGFLFADVSSLTVDRRAGRIRSRGEATFGAIVSGYDLTLARLPLDLQSGKLTGVSLPGISSKLRLGGLKVDLSRLGGAPPTVDIDLAAGTLRLAAGVDYKLVATTISMQGSLDVTRSGVVVDLSAHGLKFPLRIAGRQLFALKSLTFHYDQAKDAWSIGGGAEVSLPAGFGADASATGGIRHGRFDSLSLALKVKGGAGIPGPFGTYVSGGSFDISGVADGFKQSTIGLGLDGGWPIEGKKIVGIDFEGKGSFDVAALRLKLGADAKITADDVQLADGRATLTVDFDDPQFQLSTEVDVLDLITGSADLRIDGAHFISQSKLSVQFGPGSPPIKYVDDHWPFSFFVDPPDHLGPFATADAILSDQGAGARAQLHVWKLKLGATVIKRWGHELDYDVGFGTTEPITGLSPATGQAAHVSARAAARGRSAVVRVPRGRQALVVSGTGSPSGQLTLRDPRGHVVVATRSIATAVATRDHGGVLFSRRATLGTAGVIVRRPRPGRWRVSSSGPAPFARVSSTTVGPQSSGLGRVLSVAPRRRVRAGQRLRVAVAVPRGTTVQVRATTARHGDDAGVALGVARHRVVGVRVPGGAHGRLTLIAVTRRRGVPVGRARSRVVLQVARRGLGRPGRLRVTRGGDTTVRFARVRGAARYVITVSVRGRRYQTVVRSTRARLPIATGGARTTVTVAAVSATTARVGPAARTVAGRPARHRGRR